MKTKICILGNEKTLIFNTEDFRKKATLKIGKYNLVFSKFAKPEDVYINIYLYKELIFSVGCLSISDLEEIINNFLIEDYKKLKERMKSLDNFCNMENLISIKEII
jgi:hypothetical protein